MKVIIVPIKELSNLLARRGMNNSWANTDIDIDNINTIDEEIAFLLEEQEELLQKLSIVTNQVFNKISNIDSNRCCHSNLFINNAIEHVKHERNIIVNRLNVIHQEYINLLRKRNFFNKIIL